MIAKRSAPSALRNRGPILSVLLDVLPPRGTVLEIASGTGEHALHFASALPDLVWQPSDPDPEARASTEAWIAAEGTANLRPPIDLDAAAPDWPVTHADAILAINMVHISPWDATLGLLAGAGRLLPTGGIFYLYGPYARAGVDFAPSNQAFHEDLRRRNPAWGIRSVEDVAAAAEQQRLTLDRIVEMPANNLSLVFVREAPAF